MKESTRSQVTTKRGDTGTTVALSGDTLSKAHPVLEATGCVDAARAYTARFRLMLESSMREDRDEILDFIHWLMHVYFLIGSHCNDPENKHPEYRNRDLSQKHLDTLESFQAGLEQRVKLPKYFILSATTMLSAEADIVCVEVRRLERALVQLKEAVPDFDTSILLPFVNRLSDTLFMLARLLEDGQYRSVDYDVLGNPDEKSQES
ncbi:MAG: hypothetical protein COA73_07980 [Candidatus Hydrogenedentota bacterium]|nr:MAG: hypothetical protein COA73_07980 [Candidatus Hydrogenedentota bacterium]